MQYGSVVEFNVEALKIALQTVQSVLDDNWVLQSKQLEPPEQKEQFEQKKLLKPPEFIIHCTDTVASTNQMLWNLIDQGAGAGTVAIAAQQQSGRGQWGRQWQSLRGGLYLSVGLRPQQAIEHAPQITLCSAWGIAITLRQYGIPVQLKWLNDLVLNGYKLGGILTETRVRRGQLSDVVVGIGINWTNAVPKTGINLETWQSAQRGSNLFSDSSQANSSQANSSHTITSLELLGAIALCGLMKGYTYWQHYGIESLIPHYEQLLVNLGQRVEVEGRSGEIVGINGDGTLRIHLLDPLEPSLKPSESLGHSPEISVEPGMIQLGYGQHG